MHTLSPPHREGRASGLPLFWGLPTGGLALALNGMMFRRALRLLLAACFLLLWQAAGIAAPAAGVVISNTAQSTYVDSATGLSVRLNSNTVTTRVTALEALTLTASQSVLLGPGTPFTVSHTLTNTGNTDSSFVFATTASGAFAPLNVQVVRDVNGNGRIDSGEPVLGAAGVDVPMGTSVAVIVNGLVPATATAGQAAQVVLTATSRAQGAQASNTDTLTLTAGPAVQVMLAASVGTATPDGTVDWTAVAVNNGSIAAAAASFTADGIATTAFLLRAPVPINTTFTSATASGNVGARTLYHVLGAPASTYVSMLPAGATVDGVAWSLPNLPAGGSLQGGFRVHVNANAAGTISDTAFAEWSDAGTARVGNSNTVTLALPGRAPQIGFYTASTYATPAIVNSPGRPLFVQADAATCNADSAAPDTVAIRLVSQLTGDVETFTGVETGPNTGLFRIQPEVPTANAATHVVAAGDGVLEVLRNDVVTATITSCAGGSATAVTTLLIDPSGVVYDSRTNQPLAGATVELIDVTGAGNGGQAGMAASVLSFDTVTPAPASVVTGPDGVFTFPLVQGGTYRLRVTPPSGFTFPSALGADLQPAGRLVQVPGSFGGSFAVAAGPVRFDVPLDTGATGGLFVQKVASKATAQVGDFVDYTVTVKNVLAVALSVVEVRDLLPAGFTYVKGSTRANGTAFTDPVGGAGPRLTFSLAGLPAGGQAVLSYRVRVGVGSQNGNGINTAQASAGGVTSNVASARVQVVGGVFANDAYVIGKVFADCSRDGVQNAGEPGIPGVRIYLEDGTYVVTDEDGKYSFYGLTPRTHVAKLDATTLPAGATLRVLDQRNAGDAGSRFLDLKNGELHKADFAIAECDAGIRGQVEARRKALRNPSEIAQAAGLMLQATPQGASTTDTRTLPATGALGLPGAGRSSTPAAAAPTQSALPGGPSLGAVGDTGGSAGASLQGMPQPIYKPVEALLAQQPAGQATAAAAASDDPRNAQPLEDLLPQLTPGTAFVGLAEGQVLATAQTRVRVKGPLGAEFQLTVNGRAVPATQVGKRSSLPQTKVTAWEYIGVDLTPGRNVLAVKAMDPFGNARGQAQVTVLAPGPLASIQLDVPAQPVADASTPLAVVVHLRDAGGLPVTARTQLTLFASAGQWQVTDSDTHQAGTQVLVEGGSGRFLLLPPAQPGKAELKVVGGATQSVVNLDFVPRLRPMIAAGVLEGTINLRNLNPGSVVPATSADVFEREIRSASRSFDDGKGEVAARAALFLQGKVLGSSLLTVAYDSDKASDVRLFRDIQPNQFYPVYGDSSARGFDGQSTGKLYVLLQNGSNYFLLGDFNTQTDNAARQLTQYARSLNGAKAHWSNGKVGVEAFASRTAATQVVTEFRANGTSGPFQLDIRGLANSEQVHVVTRSRDQPALVIKDVALAPFNDYAIEPYTGRLLLKDPVPSVDADLNPVFIRVAYDVDAGGPEHDVQGVEATVQVGTNTTVGAVAVQDNDPANRQRVAGLTLASKLGEKTVVTGELARSSTDLAGDGQGERAELRHEGKDLQVRAWGVHTDKGFANTGSPQSGGQSEYGAKAGYTLNDANRVVGEVLRTSNATTGAEQTGAELRLEHSLPGNAKLEVGMRYSSSNVQAALSGVAAPGTATTSATTVVSTTAPAGTPTEQVATTTARVKLTVPVPKVPEATVFGLAEQAVDGSNGREVAIGGDYALNAGTRAYLRHDFINSLNGPYTLSSEVSRYTTVAGINTVLPDNTQLFNEYRVGGAIDGRTAEAAIGLRKTVTVTPGLTVHASLQRIKPVQGPTTDDSTAVALGAEYTRAADWKASAQAQWQTSSTSRSWLVTGATVHKIDRDWTLLNRVLYNDQVNTGTASGARELVTAQSGVAFRPVDDDTVNGLARVEYKKDKDTTVVQGTDETSWLFSTHLNIQPRRDWLASARYAARIATERGNQLESRSFTQLLGGRVTWDFAPGWDVGLQAYGMWGDGAREGAIGVEIGYQAWKNLWVSVGYNFKGFSAKDLAGDAHTMQGAYVRLRYKFDETLLEGKDNGGSQAPAAVPQQP